jgi:hypothetical protein
MAKQTKPRIAPEFARSEKLYPIFESQGFLIGSRAYGGHRSDSDWDIVICEDTYQKILESAKKAGITIDHRNVWGFSGKMDEHNMFNTLNDYIRLPVSTKMVNIIAYRKKDMPLIREVHEAMLALVGTKIGDRMAEDKQVRINIFQTFKDEAFRNRHYKEMQPVKVVPKSTHTIGFAKDKPTFNADDDIPF